MLRRLSDVAATALPLVGVADPVGAVAAPARVTAVGSTAVSTGSHVHFEVLLPGGDAVDPLPWLEQDATPAA
ncbi:hypothetical protein [Leifsonia sp. 2MCAF36]|uniref:hypothetical protein n=1 Tax=Leifsonia sp. 2MCAF36 TaxID=3232988 RepID=UPI003F9471F6